MSDHDVNLVQERRIEAELARAVELDSSFAEAWGELAFSRYLVALDSPGDRAAEERMRATFDQALARAPGQPRLLLALFYKRMVFDRETAGGDTLVRRAIAAAPNDVGVLRSAGATLFTKYARYDTGYALVRRAAMLDPRSGLTVARAANIATRYRRWADARHYAGALVALDSANPRAWADLLRVSAALGDTLALRRDLAAALASLPGPAIPVSRYMVAARGPWPARFIALSPRELELRTWMDSADHAAARAAAFTLLGDSTRRRIHLDSLRVLLAGRALGGGPDPEVLARLAVVQAQLGRRDEARRTLARAEAVLRETLSGPADESPLELAPFRAAVHAQTGEPEEAVRWLERSLAHAGGGTTARAFALDPWLLPLHGTGAFERFLRARPD